MNTNQPTIIQQWFTNQIVSQTDMNTFTNDLYSKIAALSNDVYPCIIAGGQVISPGSYSDITILPGIARCNQQTASYEPNTPVPGIFLFDGTTISFPSGSGYIVAQLTVSPTSPGLTTYNFTGSITTLPNGTGYTPNSMVILGQYESDGSINYWIRANDFLNLQTTLAGFQRNYITTDAYSIPYTQLNNIIPLSASGISTLSLPDVFPDINAPLKYTITNLSSSIITISALGGKTILNAANFTLWQNSSITTYFSVFDNTWLFI